MAHDISELRNDKNAVGGQDDIDAFFSANYWRAYDQLFAGLREGKIANALIGPSKSAKVMIAHKAFANAPRHLHMVRAGSPPSSAEALIKALHGALGAAAAAPDAPNERAALEERLRQLAAMGRAAVAQIECADRASDDVLKTLGELTRLGQNAEGERLGLRVLLIARPNFEEKLAALGETEMAAAAREASPIQFFTPREAAACVKLRLANAIDEDAAELLAQAAESAPALVRALCDEAEAFMRKRGAARISLTMAKKVVDASEAPKMAQELRADPANANAWPEEIEEEQQAPAPQALEVAPLEADEFTEFNTHDAPQDAAKSASSIIQQPSASIAERDKLRERLANAERSRRRQVTIGVTLAGVLTVSLIANVQFAQRHDEGASIEHHRAAGRAAENLLSSAQHAHEAISDGITHSHGAVLGAVEGALNSAAQTGRAAAENAPSPLRGLAAAVADSAAQQERELRDARLTAHRAADGAPEYYPHFETYLTIAQQRIEAEQLTHPVGASAYDALLDANALAPNNPLVAAKLEEIAKIYTSQANDALNAGKYEEFYQLQNMMERIRARKPL